LVGFLKVGLGVAFAAYGGATLAAALGRSWWLFELVTHFRPHLLMAGVGFCLVFLACRQPRWMLAALAVATVNALPLLPYLTPMAGEARASEGRPFRVLTLNLYHRHADMAAVARLIRAEQPDAVLLTELIPGHLKALGALADLLPYRVHAAAAGSGNLMLLSRWTVSQPAVHGPDPTYRPILEARLCAPENGEDCVTLIGLHAPLPFFDGAELRAVILDRAAERAKAAGGRVVLLGDLNCTPWSPAFHDLLAVGGLSDAAKGKSLAATWQSRVPIVGLPIDHVLVGRAVGVQDRRVGPDVGSDHLPVIADLSLRGS
jgi:endonuclease/exonuclease/phosphatase (EEP) superfamily protein YafD